MSGWLERRRLPIGASRGRKGPKGGGTPGGGGNSNKPGGGDGGGGRGGGRGRGGGGGGSYTTTDTYFYARKATASGSANNIVASWDSEVDAAGVFNQSTGVFSPDAGVWLTGSMGYVVGASAAEAQHKIRVDTGAYSLFRGYVVGTDHRWSSGGLGLINAAGTEAVDLFQTTDPMDNCEFWGWKIGASVGFQVYKATASGSLDAIIDTYSLTRNDLGNDFNETTGEFTVPSDGKYLLWYSGAFPTSGLANAGRHGISIRIGGVEEHRWEIEITTPASNNLGASANGAIILDLSTSDVVSLYQHSTVAGETVETCFFGGVKLPTETYGFHARKAAASGSADEDIGGWTEDWDTGSVFNATSGEFTAPTDGTYLVLFSGEPNPIATNTDPAPSLELRDGSGTIYYDNSCRIGGDYDNAWGHATNLVVDLSKNDVLKLHQDGFTFDNLIFSVTRID